jgi:undecaprenyl-diphosphatase
VHWLLQLDGVARAWVVAHRVRALDGVMWALSAVGEGGMIWVAIAAALVLVKRLTLAGLARVALSILLASLVVNQVLKPAIGRDRPFVVVPDVLVIGPSPADRSFPSGHAGNSFAAATALTRVAPAGTAAWWTLAVLIAYSRVYLGVHYPLDVLAGALVGIACAAVALSIRARSRTRP